MKLERSKGFMIAEVMAFHLDVWARYYFLIAYLLYCTYSAYTLYEENLWLFIVGIVISVILVIIYFCQVCRNKKKLSKKIYGLIH